MPRVKKTDGGRVYVRSVGRRFSVGDEANVSEGEAEYLLEEREDFALLDAGDEDAGESASDDEEDGFDVEAFLDRTPVEDVEEDIHAGEVDDHLDAVQEAADRVTVETAAGERRAELEE